MGRWGDGEMGRWGVRWFDNIPSCLLLACLLPLASCPHNSHTPPVP
ncbi:MULTISPECIES: hypothetical protein [unclassified Moorena]|nr:MULTISPECIES: hypothetical protein [unclassified Moorena]NEO13136.1 hypothetical protein [Moorena sp. SIO3E8]NEP98154.1 hypothetical protein [Moorena sp. SIO3F7]